MLFRYLLILATLFATLFAFAGFLQAGTHTGQTSTHDTTDAGSGDRKYSFSYESVDDAPFVSAVRNHAGTALKEVSTPSEKGEYRTDTENGVVTITFGWKLHTGDHFEVETTRSGGDTPTIKEGSEPWAGLK